MSEQIFGLTADGIARTAETNRRVLGQFPDTGRRTRRVYTPGGAGGGAEIVHFRTESLCYGLNLGSGCSCVEAVVTRVPCNSTIAVGDSITLWDPDQCYFNIPADLLIGLQGTAMLMKTGSDLGGAHCVQTPDIGACMWVVHTLCCAEESYA